MFRRLVGRGSQAGGSQASLLTLGSRGDRQWNWAAWPAVIPTEREAPMYGLESLKKTLEKITGIGKSTAGFAHATVRPRRAHTIMFEDDGSIPNNPRLPLIHYRGVVRLADVEDPAAVFEELFASNGWGFVAQRHL